MDSFQERLISGAKFLRLKSKDSVNFVGPVQLIVQKIEFPATEMRDLLRAFESLLTLPKRLLRLTSNPDLIFQLGIRKSQFLCPVLDPHFKLSISLIKPLLCLFVPGYILAGGNETNNVALLIPQGCNRFYFVENI